MPYNKKILIVDDEETVCDFLSEYLQGVGFSVETALNGEEAVTKIGTDFPDLVLLDIAMPNMDGIDVLKKLKKEGISVPIIVVTGLLSRKIADEALKLGAIDYLTKPIDLPVLKKRILTVLSIEN